MSDQRSLYEQMVSLLRAAERDGLYDAADWIKRTFFRGDE